MSKELEALKKLGALEICIRNNGHFVIHVHDILEYNTLLQAITPPTAEEVCEALSEWVKKEFPDLFNYKVYYDNGGFHYYNDMDFEDYLVEYYEVDETMTLSVFLPLHIVEMVARFYKENEK